MPLRRDPHYTIFRLIFSTIFRNSATASSYFSASIHPSAWVFRAIWLRLGHIDWQTAVSDEKLCRRNLTALRHSAHPCCGRFKQSTCPLAPASAFRYITPPDAQVDKRSSGNVQNLCQLIRIQNGRITIKMIVHTISFQPHTIPKSERISSPIDWKSSLFLFEFFV